MKKIQKYESFEDAYEKLKNKNFRFLTFNEDLREIELLTVENNDEILAYAVLQKAENMKKDLYIKLVENLKWDISSEKYLIEILYEDLEDPICDDDETIDEAIDEINEELKKAKNKLKVLKKSLKAYKRKDFYYVAYVEAIPQNDGNGTMIAEYIKNNYRNTVLIASGYKEDRDKPFKFWVKMGYTNTNYSSMLIQNP